MNDDQRRVITLVMTFGRDSDQQDCERSNDWRLKLPAGIAVASGDLSQWKKWVKTG